MTHELDRRRLLGITLGTLPSLIALATASRSIAEDGPKLPALQPGGGHDFDFFLGSWRVHHRRLRKRLAGSDDWEEFEGTTRCQTLLDGLVNVNESIGHRSSGTTRGLGIRAFDAKTNTWADWYLSGAAPTEIGPPGIGRFENGVGTFLSDEEFEGRPVKVRGRFTSIHRDLAQWEQAFSPDAGKTWETNWVMRYSRQA